MLRTLALAVSLFAFAGVAAADCSDAHADKEAMARNDKAPATYAPAVKSAALPAGKQGSACETANCDGVVKPATATRKTAKKPATPASSERLLVAKQCESGPCR